MRARRLEKTETKSRFPGQAVERRGEVPDIQSILIPQHEPLARAISWIGNTSSSGTHASTLSRVNASQSSRIQHSMLQLQRQYGNRCFQRLLAVDRQGAGEAKVTPEVERSIQRARGGGQALGSGVRAQMEPAFGADFSGVRVHADAQADALNRSLNARAFTTGQDIFFRQGAYNPGSSSGRELMAHELTHVVQQTGAKAQPKLVVNAPGDKFEQEADQVARVVTNQERQFTPKQAHTTQVGRQAEEEEEEPVQTRLVQRQAEEEKEEPVQTRLVQRQAEEEEETTAQTQLLQRQAEEEEEQPVQMRLVQRQAEEEDEQPVQTGLLQRQAEEDEDTTAQAQLLQRQAEEEEEPVQTRLVQRQAEEEEEEPVQTRLAQRQAEEEEETAAQTQLLQRQAEEEEEQPAQTQLVQRQVGNSGAASAIHSARAPTRRLARTPQSAGPSQRATPGPSAATPTPEPGAIELKTGTGMLPVETLDQIPDWSKGRRKIKVRFGDLARGELSIKKIKKKKESTYAIAKKGSLPLDSHPLFNQLRAKSPQIAPHLIVKENKQGQIQGYVGVKGAWASQLKKAPQALGLPGFSFTKSIPIKNELKNGRLDFGLEGVEIAYSKVLDGNFTLKTDDQGNITFSGQLGVRVKKLAKGKMKLERSPEGVITGKATVDVDGFKAISGKGTVVWNGEMVFGQFTVAYQGEKFSGEITLWVMGLSQAEQLLKSEEAPDIETLKPEGKPKKEEYVVFGVGDLTFAFTDWLNGKAKVTIDPDGHLTVVGEITPNKEFRFWEKPKEYNKELPGIRARATYGIPVVGNIFIEGSLSLGLFASLDGKLYNIEIEGEYSTESKKKQDFRIKGVLNISAAAGLRLRAEAGAGLEVLAHDIKAGAGLNALAGIRGYAEATPVIGYREKETEGGEDKKGEFFIRGDLEVAAQPFLGLSGDLFVETDAPWWSPVPDKRWTWPLGEKEWPIGGSVGFVASVDYVFGSDQAPAVEFGEVDFSADKFLTDLYADKATSKSGAKEKKGDWREKNAPEAAPPPKDGKKGTAKEGKAPALGQAKPPVQPGGPKKAVKPATDNARTAEGKTVKEYKEEARQKGTKPEAKEPKKGTAKEEPAAKDTGKKAHDDQLKKGLAALAQVTRRYAENGATKKEVEAGVKSVRRKFKVFKSIKVVDGGRTWDYKYVADPGEQKGPKKKTKPKLLPGEGDVGTYGELKKAGKPRDDLTPHHMPADQLMQEYGVARNDGIAMNMEQPSGPGGRHRDTRTYGVGADLSKTPLEELKADIKDVRAIYRQDGLLTSRIQTALRKVRLLNKKHFPNLFK